MANAGSMVWTVVRVCLAVAAMFAVGIGAAIATYLIVDSAQPSAATVRWDATAGTPPPPRFRIAMYPKNANVTLHASPDGPVVGTLNRALLNSWQEVQTGGWIAAGVKGGDAFVRASDLTFLPPSGTDIDWIGNLQDAITRGEMRGDQYLYNANVQEIAGPGGSRRVTLRMSWDDSADEFVADVTPTNAIPIQWKLEQAFKEFARAMPSILLGGLAFFVAPVIGALAVNRYRSRRRHMRVAPYRVPR